MMRALTFGAGLAVGYVFGTKAGRQRYEQLKSQAGKFWQNPRTQEKITEAKDTVKHTVAEKVPVLKDRLQSAGNKTDTSSAARQELDPESGTANSAFPRQAGAGISGTVPETEPDVLSDPARTDELGNDWSDEGGATSAGPATNTDPTKGPGSI
ncbi:hypothetical protein ACFQ36_08355 [Arthrobacter sp. GCM10027362]|uniref:hypothetical protein n=1 Tax=Arthrobacter sp. GCM10027362 TaxID=3273379 RepID=UPI003635CC8F